MTTLCNRLIGLGVFSSFHAVAVGSPVQVNVFGSVDGYVVDQSVTLSDPSQTLSIPIASQQLIASSGPNGYYGGGDINSSFTSPCRSGRRAPRRRPEIPWRGAARSTVLIPSYGMKMRT